MFNSLVKTLTLVIMLVAFVGQSLAGSVMSCDMAPESHQGRQVASSAHNGMDHGHMDHANMQHEVMDHSMMETASHSDCCDVECMCPHSVCSSVVILAESVVFTDVLQFNPIVKSTSFELPRSFANSLYRPPIFA